jgi:VanZ family protein
MFSRLLQLTRKLYVPVGWSVFTQIMLSLPGKLFSGPGLFKIPHLDKIAHIFLFGGLALCWILYYEYKKRPVPKHLVWTILLIISIYGVAVEFFQLYFIPNRSFEVGDIVADIGGALCGYLAAIFLKKYL